MKTKMKITTILIACVLIASAAFAGDQPSIIQFTDLHPKLDANKDKIVAVHGGVDLVSSRQGMFTIADPDDAACGDGCSKAFIVANLPEALKSKLPKPKDEVIAVGKLVLTDRGYTISVNELVVGKEAIKEYKEKSGR